MMMVIASVLVSFGAVACSQPEAPMEAEPDEAEAGSLEPIRADQCQ